MLIIILEYICNIFIHIRSKYTFVNINLPNYILDIQNTPLDIHKATTKLVTFATNGT
jgi:hypothetical protein